MKNKIVFFCLLVLITGCKSDSKVDENPIIEYKSEVPQSSIAVTSTKLIDEYKKIDPDYEIEDNYYVFKENDVKMIVGEYEKNIGITGPEVSGEEKNIDAIVDTVVKVNNFIEQKSIDKKLLKKELLDTKPSNSVDLKSAKASVQKIKGSYYIFFSEEK